MAAITSLPFGARYADYILCGVIGRGGAGVVYRARHVELDVSRAIKILTEVDPRSIDRLLTEGKLQARIQHPNVVPVHDVLSIEGYAALVMDDVDGGSLRQLLDLGRPAVVEAERIFRGIVAGMKEVHQAGFVHRDLKPANVLMDRQVAPPIPRVADFGIARVPDSFPRAFQTRTGESMGTPAYVAPEQVTNFSQVDARADVFALGVILYELLAGVTPHAGVTTFEIVRAVMAGERTPLRQIRTDLRRELEDVVDACLAPDPRNRPPDAAMVERMLDGFHWFPPRNMTLTFMGDD